VPFVRDYLRPQNWIVFGWSFPLDFLDWGGADDEGIEVFGRPEGVHFK
jgi:hypothetical protein